MNIDKKYYQEINQNLTNTIQDTNINAPNKKVGKVRDAYFLNEKVVMISTDRQSAFDRVLAAIPYKGAVLNSVSAWWFKQTEHLFPNQKQRALHRAPHQHRVMLSAGARASKS